MLTIKHGAKFNKALGMALEGQARCVQTEQGTESLIRSLRAAAEPNLPDPLDQLGEVIFGATDCAAPSIGAEHNIWTTVPLAQRQVGAVLAGSGLPGYFFFCRSLRGRSRLLGAV